MSYYVNLLIESYGGYNERLPDELPEPINPKLKYKFNDIKKYITNKTSWEGFYGDSNSDNYYNSYLRGSFTNPNYFIYYKGECPVMLEMTPDEYIEWCCYGFDEPRDQVEGVRRRFDSGEKIESLKDTLRNKKIDSVFLKFYKEHFGQEGLHRAIAAKDLGIEKIPVLLIYACEPDVAGWIDGKYGGAD